jgi:hypothetical protein
MQLLAGQRAGHRHLALRPSQILICPDRESERGISVHLVGLAEALGLQRPSELSAPREVVVAPEQTEAAASSKIDERAEGYARSVLLRHLLLGYIYGEHWWS